jgi:hypothetical protein
LRCGARTPGKTRVRGCPVKVDAHDKRVRSGGKDVILGHASTPITPSWEVGGVFAWMPGGLSL